MIIECGYNINNKCTCYNNEDISIHDCNKCPNKTEVYTDEDKIKLLYEAFKSAKKEKSDYDVVSMKFIFGHSASMNNDFNDIYYDGYNLWLVLHKKDKYISIREIFYAYETMQLMKMSVPKRIRRIVRRIKKTCRKKWWYEET